jgi:hypothetical protein
MSNEKKDIEKALSFVSHISSYALTVEPKRPWKMIQTGKWKRQKDDVAQEWFYDFGHLESNGLLDYECPFWQTETLANWLGKNIWVLDLRRTVIMAFLEVGTNNIIYLKSIQKNYQMKWSARNGSLQWVCDDRIKDDLAFLWIELKLNLGGRIRIIP